MANYDPGTPGLPYVRVTQLILDWPDGAGGLPSATIFQRNAVPLTDGTVRNLEELPLIHIPLDLVNHGDDPIPLINPTNGQPLGGNTTLNEAFVAVLAVIRQAQLTANQ